MQQACAADVGTTGKQQPTPHPDVRCAGVGLATWNLQGFGACFASRSPVHCQQTQNIGCFLSTASSANAQSRLSQAARVGLRPKAEGTFKQPRRGVQN